MVEELDLETYLYVSPNKLEIYLFDKNNLNNLYEDKIKFINNTNDIDFNILDKFLEKNIFKIEKLAGNFIKNIFLIIENNESNQVNFGIKKKNYENIINDKFLQNILIDAKDLFRENYKNNNIMHILIMRYFENDKYHSSFSDEFRGNYLCIEFQFKYISDKFISEINKVLKKYQVELTGCFDSKYVKSYFVTEQIPFPEMVYKIKRGINENEVKLISKNIENRGFFEKFFQLFS